MVVILPQQQINFNCQTTVLPMWSESRMSGGSILQAPVELLGILNGEPAGELNIELEDSVDNKSIDTLLALSARFAKQHRMGFTIEPFPACSGCDFWFRLPRGRRAHAGCAFLSKEVFLFSEAFNWFGRSIERKEYSYLPIEQLSSERLFQHVLSEQKRLELMYEKKRK